MFWVLSLASYQAGERSLSRGAGTRWSPLWVCMVSHCSHHMVTGVATGSDISSAASRVSHFTEEEMLKVQSKWVSAQGQGWRLRPALSVSFFSGQAHLLDQPEIL